MLKILKKKWRLSSYVRCNNLLFYAEDESQNYLDGQSIFIVYPYKVIVSQFAKPLQQQSRSTGDGLGTTVPDTTNNSRRKSRQATQVTKEKDI